ncbi:SRPBCC family protein [Actibacterium sp. MT2.3-13A]|uniref:SRPBCC family protein n=1 Tax=Actibacterium sp. MT2.3-13A TaxID=2828332 RepID=UPI001BAA25A9|nr:SRPBCC family protein [Actibacterium sp. MT2.3-13A]
MQFTAKEDIAAPIEAVFAAATDFETFERGLLRRGVEVMRTDSLSRPGPGMGWEARFEFRGRPREVTVDLLRADPPEGLELAAESAGVRGQMTVDLVALSPRQTRMQVTLVLKPRTLPGRMLVQSMRLAKGSLLKRYRKGVRKFAREIEARLAGGAARGG